ncbi:RagB/SusD family nutrient uptake outer membrane protein [uncultured Proteiniphilum sp.]|uniref:RagB/SusD family nutrient uptake outer membrane protein n=1 Tax=uncultured Proteiniphilum sp. TaxID=497637 RepID=UPI00262C7A68|nr:RagB/SusD family nutrient uptake outer membrane protein [uncultured Proteiniphilum sp.]
MKIKIYYILVLFIVTSIIGCESDDSFLRENPFTFYTVDNAFSTSAQVDQALIANYSYLRSLWANPNGAAWIYDFRGNGTDMYDVANIRSSSTFNNYGEINPLKDNFYQIFNAFYGVIARANLTIYSAELPQVTWASETDKAYALAQARFFRAFAYKNLGELFGGIPIVTEIVTTPRYDFERTTRIETYQYAIDEMEAIENDLPETTNSGGRLVRGAVQHNLCELYLALGIQMAAEGNTSGAQTAFTKSITYGDKVINGGIYSLINSRYGKRKNENAIIMNVYKDGVTNSIIDTLMFSTNYYWDLFQEGNVNYQDGNTECIWAMQIDYAAYRAGDTKSRLPHTRAFVPVFRVLSAHMKGTLEDLGGRGISITMPTMYTRDSIWSGKFNTDMRNSDICFRRRFKGNVASSPYYKKVIPWDFIYNGDPNANTNTNNKSIMHPISCKVTTDKFTGVSDGEDMSYLFRDDYFIRLPETILLRAEAKQRSGDKTGAAADINLLRVRAQCSYLVTASDMDDDFNMILDERARELMYEESRWNTLLRMGGTTAVDRIRKYAYWPVAKTTLIFDYNLWPIPQKVIDSNTEVKLDQNSGWE